MTTPETARQRTGTAPPRHAFVAVDWALMASVAILWGASFLLIDIGVDHLRPELVALLRLVFGVAALAFVPAARVPLPRTAWPRIALLGVVWMAVPFVLFPFAEQQIDSSLAGMINASAPLFTVLVAVLMYRRAPAVGQAIGLLVGFFGVIAVAWPSLSGTYGTAVGVGLALLATILYGFAFNLAAPLQQRHGALPVVWRAQIVAMVLLAPWGLSGITGSTFAWSSVLAVAALGVLGTAIAFVAFVALVGRVGSTRASITVYFLPAVAILLGAVVRAETLSPLSLAGAVLVAAGAYATSRESTPASRSRDPSMRPPRSTPTTLASPSYPHRVADNQEDLRCRELVSP